MSFYSGPNPYIPPTGEQPNERWAGLGWNPIQSGDVGGHRSRLLEYKNDGESIYVRCVPMHWPHVNVPGECTFECTYTLNGNAVEATAVLNNARPDETQYRRCDQELPAIYTNGPWYKLVTYVGDRPFEDEPLSVLVDKNDERGWPWLKYVAPEHWAALVDENDYGLGVYQPISTDFLGGFSGGDDAKGHGGEKDGPTGYLSPLSVEILDHNIRYEYNYSLIAGSLEDIRQYAYEKNEERADTERPCYLFDSDRAQWGYNQTTDSGWPIEGELSAAINPARPSEWIGPQTFWRAENAPRLEIEAACDGPPGTEGVNNTVLTLTVVLTPFGPNDLKHSLHWGGPARPEPSRLRIPLTLPRDGEFHSLTLDLTKIEGYEGGMTEVRLAVPQGEGTLRVRRVEFLQN